MTTGSPAPGGSGSTKDLRINKDTPTSGKKQASVQTKIPFVVTPGMGAGSTTPGSPPAKPKDKRNRGAMSPSPHKATGRLGTEEEIEENGPNKRLSSGGGLTKLNRKEASKTLTFLDEDNPLVTDAQDQDMTVPLTLDFGEGNAGDAGEGGLIRHV